MKTAGKSIVTKQELAIDSDQPFPVRCFMRANQTFVECAASASLGSLRSFATPRFREVTSDRATPAIWIA